MRYTPQGCCKNYGKRALEEFLPQIQHSKMRLRKDRSRRLQAKKETLSKQSEVSDCPDCASDFLAESPTRPAGSFASRVCALTHRCQSSAI